MERILIVEDDKHISRLLDYNLTKAGYICQSVVSGEEALKILGFEQVDLVILDIMLPGADGFEICRAIREKERTCSIPVIMLTAKGEEVDRVVGLTVGADDYIVKPFSPRELILRVKAVLKRGRLDDKKKEIIESCNLRLDTARHKVTLNQKEVILTPMEFNLLYILMQRPGRVQTREGLLAEVWDIHNPIDTRTVDTHVKRLREKLGPRGAKLIETVRAVGYRFREDDAE